MKSLSHIFRQGYSTSHSSSLRLFKFSSKNEQNQSSNSPPFYIYSTVPVIFLSAIAVNKDDVVKKETSISSRVDVVDAQTAVNRKQIQNINYQNRLRKYSTPDKLFRFFATIKVMPKGEIFMTPEDFVKSITPDALQPDAYGLDNYRKLSEKTLPVFLEKQSKRQPWMQKTVIFDKISKNSLLTFSDYIFLLSVISTSARHWKILFKVFDQNGDGEVDRQEFSKVMKLAQHKTAVGERHRDTGDSKAKDIINKNSAIAEYFFGSRKDEEKMDEKKLKLEEFLEFHESLVSDILRLQFERENPDEQDRISKISFAKMLLTYIDRKDTFLELERVKRILEHPGRRSEGVTFDQVNSLFKVLSYIEDIEMALDMHMAAGRDIDKETFRHVSWVVAKEKLDDKCIDVMWAVLDQDASGGLSHKEFIRTIKARSAFGLDTPKDTGLWRFFSSVWVCSLKKVQDFFQK